MSREQCIANVAGAANYRAVPKKTARPVPEEIETLPERIGLARKRARLTRSAVAKKMDVAPSQVTRWENGERKEGIELATVLRLAKALGCDPAWLATDKGEPGPVPHFAEAGDKRRRKTDSDERPE